MEELGADEETDEYKEKATTPTLLIGLSDTLDSVLATNMWCGGKGKIGWVLQSNAPTTYLSTSVTSIKVDSTSGEGGIRSGNSLNYNSEHSPPSPLIPIVSNIQRARAVKPSQTGQQSAVLKQLSAHGLGIIPPTGME